MSEPRIRIYKDWVEMLNPLMISDIDSWATIVSLAIGIAVGDYEPCIVTDPTLVGLWSMTEIVPAKNGNDGIIRIKHKVVEYGNKVS